MNPAAAAREIDARLATLTGLASHYIGPRKSVSVPCSIVLFPEPINYQQAYAGNALRVPDWEVVLLIGQPGDQGAAERILTYAGTDAGTVKYVLETKGAPFTPYTDLDYVVLKTCSFEVIEWQGQQFQGATFTIDVFVS